MRLAHATTSILQRRFVDSGPQVRPLTWDDEAASAYGPTSLAGADAPTPAPAAPAPRPPSSVRSPAATSGSSSSARTSGRFTTRVPRAAGRYYVVVRGRYAPGVAECVSSRSTTVRVRR